MIESTQIYARFASEVYDDFGDVDSYQEYYRKEHADKELRKALHALWMARALRAKNLVVAFENYDYLDFGKLTIKQESAKTWMTCKLRTPAKWVKIWKNVQAKCLQKAKEFE